MRYNVAQLMKEAVGALRDYEVAERVPIPEEGWGTLQLSGMVHMLRTHRGVLLNARLVTAIQEECSRCLKPYQQSLDLEIEEEYFPLTDVVSGLPLEVPEEAGAFTINSQHLLDLLEAVRQAILLAKPIQPLCREDCAGLCPECGSKLSLGPCPCRLPAVDPRWSALRQMLG